MPLTLLWAVVVLPTTYATFKEEKDLLKLWTTFWPSVGSPGRYGPRYKGCGISPQLVKVPGKWASGHVRRQAGPEEKAFHLLQLWQDRPHVWGVLRAS